MRFQSRDINIRWEKFTSKFSFRFLHNTSKIPICWWFSVFKLTYCLSLVTIDWINECSALSPPTTTMRMRRIKNLNTCFKEITFIHICICRGQNLVAGALSNQGHQHQIGEIHFKILFQGSLHNMIKIPTCWWFSVFKLLLSGDFTFSFWVIFIKTIWHISKKEIWSHLFHVVGFFTLEVLFFADFLCFQSM